jgi:glutathione S-transferase
VVGDDAKKAAYRDVQHPDFYRRHEHFLSTNGSSQGFAAGSKVSFADALLFALLWDDAGGFGPLDLSPYPLVAALHQRFGAIPGVAACCADQRP